jgi:hypothetical protein
MKNELIKVKGFEQPTTHPDSLKVPFRLMSVGASGTGKTNAVCNYLNNYYPKHDIFNHKILISPTGTFNKETGLRNEPKFEGFADEEHSTFNKAIMKKIFDDQKARIVKHKEYLEDCKTYQKILTDEGLLTDHEIMQYFNKHEFNKPEPPFGKETYPHLLILFDDNASLTESKWLSDIASTARHYFCSLCILSQHYSQMSRGLRKQMNSLMLFKTGDEKMLKTLWEQTSASDVTWEQYLNFYKQLTDRWDFVFHDWSVPETSRRYTKCFDGCGSLI